MVPESLFSADWLVTHLPSTVTFMVHPAHVHSPQTGHPWYVEMDHEMKDVNIYSLIPQKTDNHFTSHYRVESRRPRFIGDFKYTDAWVTTNHRMMLLGNDTEVHLSQTLFSPQRADDKLYFDRPAYRRMEIVVPGRFIGDRELCSLLEEVVPKEFEIRSLLQHLP